MEFLFSIVGFSCYELLRIYKTLISNGDPIPQSHIKGYVITIVLLCIISTFVAFSLDINSKIHAIFVGFSLPCSVKNILNNNQISCDTIPALDVNDFNIVESSLDKNDNQKFINWLKKYF